MTPKTKLIIVANKIPAAPPEIRKERFLIYLSELLSPLKIKKAEIYNKISVIKIPIKKFIAIPLVSSQYIKGC